MNHRFESETWSLRLPEGWRGRRDPECETFLSKDEIGALQISAAFKDSEVDDADLRDFAADHLEAGARPRPTVLGDFVGFEIDFGDGERFWRQWFLRHGRQVLFVTYSCDHDSRGVEDRSVDAALASLKAKGQHRS